jgi:hypothetical protein
MISHAQYLQIHFLAKDSYFSRDDWDILKEKVKTYLMAQSSALNSTFFFFCASIVYAWPFCMSHSL